MKIPDGYEIHPDFPEALPLTEIIRLPTSLVGSDANRDPEARLFPENGRGIFSCPRIVRTPRRVSGFAEGIRFRLKSELSELSKSQPANRRFFVVRQISGDS